MCEEAITPATFEETGLFISDWFKIAKPDPTDVDVQTQIGCHFEEVVEMLDELDGQSVTARNLISSARTHLHILAEYLKEQVAPMVEVRDHEKMLDSLCDQVVTAIGTGTFLEYDMDDALIEVNDSNFSKFVDGKPVFKDNGKIGKGPNYREPDLAKFI